jgi:excisionase family DNA binding protein
MTWRPPTDEEQYMSVVEPLPGAVLPPESKRDQEMARTAQQCIMRSLDHSRAPAITVQTDGGEAASIQVPPLALRLFGEILGAMSEGRAVTIMPADREFTTVEAANFLRVSRPFVIKEIEEGRLRCRMVGTHRRIALEDLQAYAAKEREGQRAALRDLADADRELGLDY